MTAGGPPGGVSPGHLLVLLAEAPDDAAALACRLGCTPAAARTALARLAADGLVDGPDDAGRLALTPRARAVAARLTQRLGPWPVLALAALDDGQRERLLAVVRQLADVTGRRPWTDGPRSVH